MRVILTAAFLLCFVGVAAHASYNAHYNKMAAPSEVAEQCDDLALRLHNAVTLYLREGSAFSQTAAEWRVEAAQIATIFQAICEG